MTNLTISQYIEVINKPQNFTKDNFLSLVLNSNDTSLMFEYPNEVVFKVFSKRRQSYSGIKCFLIENSLLDNDLHWISKW